MSRLLLALLAAPLFAQLSSGTLTGLEWDNPHAYLRMDVKTADGKVVPWRLEMITPNALKRNGTTSEERVNYFVTVGVDSVVPAMQFMEDAIRYLARLSTEIRETPDQERAIFQTMTTVGQPLIYASVALGLGFMTLLFSNFVPIQKFGLLTTVTIVAAFVNDLVLLPALLATTRIITLWDLLYLKLGKDPHKTIGLFAGLRPSQAKIVTLMGELKVFPHGQAIIRKGDVGNEMYVVINGTADVFLTSDSQRRPVRQLQDMRPSLQRA